MHDLFDVLGLPNNAPIGEIRRVCAQRVRRLHPDFRVTTTSCGEAQFATSRIARDTAIDFVDMASLIERIAQSFFHEP